MRPVAPLVQGEVSQAPELQPQVLGFGLRSAASIVAAAAQAWQLAQVPAPAPFAPAVESLHSD